MREMRREIGKEGAERALGVELVDRHGEPRLHMRLEAGSDPYQMLAPVEDDLCLGQQPLARRRQGRVAPGAAEQGKAEIGL